MSMRGWVVGMISGGGGRGGGGFDGVEETTLDRESSGKAGGVASLWRAALLSWNVVVDAENQVRAV